jgi:hypothetical protein
MPKTRDPRREQFWRKAVAGWNKSGLSVRAYCSQRDLREANFYAWRRELAKRDGTMAPALKFLPVHFRAEAIVEIAIPNGTVVRVPAGVEVAIVAALIAALRSAPC